MSGDMLPDKVDVQPLARPSDPIGILALAVEQGIDPDGIATLAELAWKDQDRKAAQEFADALREFRKLCPEISKSKHVYNKNDLYLYSFAPLPRITRIVDPILDELGLSYSWDSETDDRGMMTTSCILRHVNGHREVSKFACPATEGTKVMSAPQKAASAMNFARRQTLTAVLGLTTADLDDDGAGGGTETITGDQIRELDARLAEVNADRGRFLLLARVDRLEDIPACRYDALLSAVKSKARQA